MKKLWIVLLSLALVAAFSLPASAVDVKFSGSYYVAGDYYKLNDVDKGSYGGGSDWSTAFFRQRLRVQTEFVISPGLSLITRFDALEKIWGDQNWTGARGNSFSRPAHGGSYQFPSGYTPAYWYGATAPKEQENIEFEQVYIQYMSKVGMWWIGYAPHDFWGTSFGDTSQTQALIQWILPLNQNWIIGAKYFKTYEGSSSLFNTTNRGIDSDDDAYVGIGMYKDENLEAGLKVAYRRIANFRDGWLFGVQNHPNAIPPGKIDGWLLTPYFTGQFGPVKVQSELEYWYGEIEFEVPGPRDADMRMLAFYLDGKVDLGPAYVGGRFVYASGDDPNTNKIEGSNFAPFWEACWGGTDPRFTLLLWNDDVTNWAGDVSGYGLGPGIKNAFFYQVYGGYKWGDFDFFASIAYAKADEKLTERGDYWQQKDKDYGWEFDVTATYSITNNLKYMVGFGYLKAGDFFKEKGKSGEKYEYVDDAYLLTNKLTLTF